MKDLERIAVVRLIISLICCVFAYTAAYAQVRPEIEVELVPTDDVPDVEIGVRDLLSDRRFINAMESGFPLYVEFYVALRNSRSGWFDGTENDYTVEYVVYRDPVREIWIVEARGLTEQFSSLADLRARVEQRYRIEFLDPEGSGRYYYAATVNARTLSDSDVDEVFAWLKGDHGESAQIERPGFVTRTARRLLVRVAPLPRITLDGRTGDFTVP